VVKICGRAGAAPPTQMLFSGPSSGRRRTRLHGTRRSRRTRPEGLVRRWR